MSADSWNLKWGIYILKAIVGIHSKYYLKPASVYFEGDVVIELTTVVGRELFC